jgi:hypothetical protein
LIIRRQRLKAPTTVRDDSAIADSFGAQAMSVSRLKAEDLAGDIEGIDLTPAVVEEFAGANDARHELEKSIGGAAFAVNVAILGKMQHGPDRAQRASGVGAARSRRFPPRIRCRHAASCRRRYIYREGELCHRELRRQRMFSLLAVPTPAVYWFRSSGILRNVASVAAFGSRKDLRERRR